MLSVLLKFYKLSTMSMHVVSISFYFYLFFNFYGLMCILLLNAHFNSFSYSIVSLNWANLYNPFLKTPKITVFFGHSSNFELFSIKKFIKLFHFCILFDWFFLHNLSKIELIKCKAFSFYSFKCKIHLSESPVGCLKQFESEHLLSGSSILQSCLKNSASAGWTICPIEVWRSW